MGEVELELPRHSCEQLEVGGPKVKRAAFDTAERAAEQGVAAGAAKADADLVGEDLLRCPHLIERLRVQDFLQLSDEELVREHGELDEEGACLDGAELAALEPRRVWIGADHGVLKNLAVKALPEGCWGPGHV